MPHSSTRQPREQRSSDREGDETGPPRTAATHFPVAVICVAIWYTEFLLIKFFDVNMKQEYLSSTAHIQVSWGKGQEHYVI